MEFAQLLRALPNYFGGYLREMARLDFRIIKGSASALFERLRSWFRTRRPGANFTRVLRKPAYKLRDQRHKITGVSGKGPSLVAGVFSLGPRRLLIGLVFPA